jgi:pilus assembly protein CpaF
MFERITGSSRKSANAFSFEDDPATENHSDVRNLSEAGNYKLIEETAHETSPAFVASSKFIELKVQMHQKLLEHLNLSAIEDMRPDEFREELQSAIGELMLDIQTPLNATEQKRLVSDVMDEVLGLGPIEPLLKDPTVSDILVNTFDQVYVERNGILEETVVKFKDDRHLLRIIDRIVTAVGRRVDESSPTVDARLADGSRVHAVIPPIAVDGPLLSIRKFAKIPYSMDRMISIGSITPEIAELLGAVVQCRLQVLISGGTGSGKTTMLNAMSTFISSRERIVTIEDAAELQLQQPHVARMETRPPNIEGRGEIPQRELVRNALRMRPDRVIVGEVRGGEAFDMLQAMNTGHDGSMTTIHANTPRDALARLEQMVGMTGIDLPMRSMRQQIASAINVVIQLSRQSDGTRRLVSMQEVTGMEGDVISMQEIFRFEQLGIDDDGKVIGEFRATGIRPKFADFLETRGVYLSPEMFAPDRKLR